MNRSETVEDLPQPSIPRYMVGTQKASSVGSEDSIKTQIPLPFHMAHAPEFPPQMSNSGFSQNLHGQRSFSDLNPASKAYVPSYSSYSQKHATYAPLGSHEQTLGYGQGQESSIGYGGQHLTRAVSYEANRGVSFPQQYNMQKYDDYSSATSGSIYSGAAATGEYNAQPGGFGPPPPSLNYAVGGLGTSVQTYSQSNYQPYASSSYGHQSQIVLPPSPYGPRDTSQSYGTSYHQGPASHHGSRAQGPPISMHNRPAGMSLSSGYGGSHGDGSQTHSRGSGYSGSQYSGGNQYDSNQHFSNQYPGGQQQQGNGMRPASAPKLGSGSQPISRTNSAGTHRSSPERRDSRGDRHNSDRGGVPTPGPKPYPLQVEFSSEPRNHQTPVLRSRRGQSVSTFASTDPSRKESTGAWLENLEARGQREQRQYNDQVQSPTKQKKKSRMSGKQEKMIEERLLESINESGMMGNNQTPHRSYTNPFSPASRSLGPPMLRPPPRIGDTPSNQLLTLTRGGIYTPTVDEALDSRFLPFTEYCRDAKPDTHGVVKIRNIPYSVNRPEILAFLGRNARIINEATGEPIHIIMERVTSKTLDCYVEFINFEEAVNAVNRFDLNKNGGRSGRIGQRHVEVEVSSQEQLMKDLFPKAKNTTWTREGRPIVTPRDPDDPFGGTGFQGFVSKEELVMLVKHVEAPQRSPFSKDCPQRPFECLISTLLKFPWYMVDYITINDRNLIHKATKDLLQLLVDRVDNEKENVYLTPMLLKRAWRAALLCPGFTPCQKDDIVVICGLAGHEAVTYGLAPHASEWNHLWTIGPKPGLPNDLIMYYAQIIRNYTNACKPQMSLAEQAASGGIQSNGHKMFGELDCFTDYPQELANTTLSQVARVEWHAIEQVLRHALTAPIAQIAHY